jgi:TATA-binding protein-associated factor Taf7
MVLIHRANYIDPFKQLTEYPLWGMGSDAPKCKTKDDETDDDENDDIFNRPSASEEDESENEEEESESEEEESESESDESEEEESESESDESEEDESNSQSEYDDEVVSEIDENENKLKRRRKYYKKNKEHISRLRKSSFLLCPCGSKVLSCKKAQHQNTMRHQLFVLKNPNVEIPTTATHFVEI